MLTIKQPWAELIMQSLKDVENRSWRTSYRGRLAVHAGLRRAGVDDLALDSMPKKLRRPIETPWQRHADTGKVLGTIALLDCIEDSRSPWAIDGYWHRVLRDPRPYARKVAAKGKLNLWEWSR